MGFEGKQPYIDALENMQILRFGTQIPNYTQL